MPANLENSAVATGLEKVSFILIPNKGDDKECLNYHTIALISHASKVCLKSLKLGFNSTWTKNFQMYKVDVENAQEPEIKLPTHTGSSKKQEFQKNIYFCFFEYAKAFVWITENCGKLFKRWDYQTTWPASWETCMQVRKQQLELDMEQQTGSKRKRSTSRLYIVTLLV